MCVSRSFSQYGVLGKCTFDTFYHGYFPEAGIPFFIFFWLHTLLYHIPFATERPSCFCPQGDFCPLSCLPPAFHCNRNRRLPNA